MDIIQEFEKKQIKRKIPLVRPGDTIKVHQKIKEGDKERIQIFEGVVIKIHRKYGINGNVTVRKIASGVGVEKTFPFHLPSIVKMEVIKRGKVRRAKLFYLRRLQEKAAKLKDKKLSDKLKNELQFDSEKDKEKAEKKDKEPKEKQIGETKVKDDQKEKVEEKAENKKENKPENKESAEEKKKEDKPEKDK